MRACDVLWPDATADGVVGKLCASRRTRSGPGIFGSLQALLTLKILLDSKASSPAKSCSSIS